MKAAGHYRNTDPKIRNWLERLNIWSLRKANTKWGAYALFFCALADASLLGLPAPVLFVTLILINPKKAGWYTVISTLGTLTGAVAGYSIGHFAWIDSNGEFTGIAQFLLTRIPGFSEAGYVTIHNLYLKWNLGILFIGSVLPLPYKLFSISSGIFDINIFTFCLTTVICQSIKYSLLATLTIKLGPKIKNIFGLNWKPIAIIASAFLALVIFALILF